MPNLAEAGAAVRLRVGGLQRFSTVDWPGRLAAVVFLQGCPWRCGYCHNPELLDANGEPALAWDDVLAFLRGRRGLLDGVVFSGGEPTLQAALPEAIAQVRALGFAIGLHTGGMYPERLAKVLPLLDWLGLDIKGPWHRMDAITASRGSAERARDSLARVLASGVACECRTTWSPALFPLDELHALCAELAGLGVRRWALQQLRGSRVATSPSRAALAAFTACFREFSFRAA